MFMLGLLAAVTPPHFKEWNRWMPRMSFQRALKKRGEEGVTIIRLLLLPNGSPYDCTVLHSSGSAALDAHGCKTVMELGHFTPAHDDQGTAVHSVMIRSIVWASQWNWSVDLPPDVTLSVDSLPNNAKEKKVNVAVFADASGQNIGLLSGVEGR